jgi:hypothetical protein
MALKDEIKKRKPRARVPMNGRNVLTIHQDDRDPNYQYRIVNDVGDRVEMLKERGYEVVTGKVRIGDKRVATPGAEGTPVQAHVGGGMKAVLMRIPKEYFEEDQAAKQEYVDSLEDATKTAAGDYGKVEIERK